ncbi:MAG: class I adenylate-forming enzyme family protein [Novosphingobium sp.]|nr:class I adenylate-forming enzyme family protein [Novosphingobium sp.]
MADAALSLIAGTPIEDETGQGPHTIAGYLRAVVSRHGPDEAVVLRSGEVRLSWSYDELLGHSLKVARALIASGVGKGERVGILMTNRPEFISSLFGIALAGAVPVALSTFSTRSELDYLLKASQISILLFEQQVLKTDFHVMIAELEPGIAGSAPGSLSCETFPYLRHLVSLGGVEGGSDPLTAHQGGAVESWDAFLSRAGAIPDAQVFARADGVHPSDTGGIFFSSGTTSLPKGIVHSQRAFAIQWWRWPQSFCMREPVRSWTGNGFFWSGNCSMVLGSAFSTGGTLVLQRYFDAEEALDLIERERLTFINGRPHQWARLHAASNWEQADLSSLRYIPRGELIWEHPSVDTDWVVPMAFGTTETMTVCTGFTADTPHEFYLNSFGGPFPGNVIKIVDPLTGTIKPLGEIGEMCIKGPTLMSGYLGKSPEECFDAEGFFCTGDGGYVDAEGRFFWEGRLTDMIKTGGANVSPVEVDDVLANFPGVKRTQTVGVPDDLLGEIVVACIVPIDGLELDEQEIVAFVKAEIASFKVPRRVLFFSDEDYAITGSEKVKSSVVRDLATKRIEAENAPTA